MQVTSILLEKSKNVLIKTYHVPIYGRYELLIVVQFKVVTYGTCILLSDKFLFLKKSTRVTNRRKVKVERID
jgi:hypothetical protein